MKLVRKTTLLDRGMDTKVFGPYADHEEAQAAISAWAESRSIRLETGLPYPGPDFWVDGGKVMLFIEDGMGNPGRKDIE